MLHRFHFLVLHELFAWDVIAKYEIYVLWVGQVEVRVENFGQAAVVLVPAVELDVAEVVQHLAIIKRSQQLSITRHA